MNSINDAPTISDIDNQTIDEDSATGPLAFVIGDVETSASGLTVTTTSSNTTLITSENLTLAGSGASRTLVATPAANQFGTATITLTVSDGTTTSSDTFLVTVNSVNDAPSISDIFDQTTNRNSSTSLLNFAIGDLESSASDLLVTATSSNGTLIPAGSFSFGG